MRTRRSISIGRRSGHWRGSSRTAGGAYRRELGAEFASLTTSPRTGRFSVQRRFDFTRVVALFDVLVDTGEVDLQTRKRGGAGRRPVSAESAGLDAAWEAAMAERGLAAATRGAYGRLARGYLVFLEDHRIAGVDRAGAETVTGFLESLLDRWAKSSLFWVVSNFRPFLVFTGRWDLVDAVNLARVRRSYKILPAIADDDVGRVVDACAAPGVVPARDASITLLALTTGVRHHRLASGGHRLAGWDDQHRPAQDPQRGHVAVAHLVEARLADYVLTERPRVDDDHVFLRRVAKHTPLSDHATIHRITTTVFAAAGVSEVNAGTRLLRHTAASGMLRATTALPTISVVLGHASIESTSVYLSVDDERLRGCVLPVPMGARS